MASWTNATASTKGILRPVETVEEVGLVRDYPVAPELQPFVERYWSVRWDRRGLPGYRSEVLSHPTVNLSVETGERPRFGFAMPAVLVHGAVTRRFVVDLDGWGRVTAAKFRPGGFAAMTGVLPRRDSVHELDLLDPARCSRRCWPTSPTGRAPPRWTGCSPRSPSSRPGSTSTCWTCSR